MKLFLSELRQRNELLFYLGAFCLLLSVLFLLLAATITVKVMGVNAWYKPLKFALSIGIYSWTMAWLTHYLASFNGSLFAWTVIVLLGFEIVYIALQAARGQLSHYNTSTPFYGALYALMGFAATAVTLYTAYIGVLFFQGGFPQLERYYRGAFAWGCGSLLFSPFRFF